jgi:hypothetical protein
VIAGAGDEVTLRSGPQWWQAVLGWLLITAVARADEAMAVATLKQNGGLIGVRTYDGNKPVTRNLEELRSLFIGKAQITDAGMKELKGLSKLEGLIVDDTRVTGTGVYELIALPKLESLLLNRTRVTDEGLKLMPYFKNLKQVQVWETPGVTKPGVKSLRTALPQLRVGHASVIGS